MPTDRTRPPHAPGSGSGNSDRELEDLLGVYLDRLNDGEFVDPEEVRAEHPELADRILDELKVFIDLQSGRESQTPLGLLGDYTLRRQIGRGGMGVVYEAWENSMDRRVALKVLPQGIAADTKAFTRFCQEAKLAGQLHHPNIVAVFGMGIKEDTPHFSMEFIEGETLAQIVAKFKDAPPEMKTPFGFPRDDVAYFSTLARTFADVADGLQHAHSHKIVHRDIKPSNLILDVEGRLRILDFGLAHLEGQESLTASGDFLGTPLYMSPEQARRKKIPVDHRTDVYSLGASLYELLTLQPPFRGKDHQETLSQIIERDPVPPCRINARVPRDLETIVLKCLRKDAGDRYGTAEAMGQDLRRFVRNEPIEARPLSSLERMTRRLRRNWARVVFSSAVAGLIGVTAVLVLVLWTRHRDHVVEEYRRIVNESLATLEIPIVTTPGHELEGESLSLGLVYPGDLDRLSGARELYEAALASLHRAADLQPDRPDAHLGMSRALRALRRDAEATERLHQAVAAAPGFLPALLQRAGELGRLKETRAADALLTEVLSRPRNQWEELWLAAHLATLRGEWVQVDELYGRLLDRADEPFVSFEMEIRLRRGRVALKRQAYWRAVQDFSRVAEEWPNGIGPALLLATTYFLSGEKEAAIETIDHVFTRHPGGDAAIAAASLLQSHGEPDRARAALERIPDAGRRGTAMAQWLYDSGRYDEAATAAREAQALGLRRPRTAGLYAWSLFMTGRIDEARAAIEDGLEAYPGDTGLLTLLGRYYHYTYDILKAREVLRPIGTEEACQFLGKGHWELEEFEPALAAFSRAIELYPRHAEAYSMRAVTHLYAGRPKEAVEGAAQALAIKPYSWDPIAVLLSVYSPDTEELFTPYWDKLWLAFSAGARRDPRNPRLLALLALATLKKTDPDPEAALAHAQRAVEVSERMNAVALASLAEVELARGRTVEAVRLLERGQDGYDRLGGSLRRLDLARRSLFPGMASCASIDTFLASEDARSADIERVRAALAASRSELGVFLEARMRERAGDEVRAGELLEELVIAGRSADETALLAFAKSCARRGDREGALKLVEERLLSTRSGSPRAWFEWLRLASQPPALTVQDLMARPPLRVEAGAEHSFVANVRWALGELDRSGAIRIDCGASSDLLDAEGHTWSRDRFGDSGYLWNNPAPRVSGAAIP
ncbi:MAG: protein kinase [Planctomycetes bacterium]|nr:protein kinase [Planctomycetota bacterium]